MTATAEDCTPRSLAALCLLLLGSMLAARAAAAETPTPGHSIGQVSTTGDLIVIGLDSAALGQPHLFDLAGRTLQFSPVGSSYRVTNEPLRWDPDFGSQLTGADVSLQRFSGSTTEPSRRDIVRR